MLLVCHTFNSIIKQREKRVRKKERGKKFKKKRVLCHLSFVYVSLDALKRDKKERIFLLLFVVVVVVKTH